MQRPPLILLCPTQGALHNPIHVPYGIDEEIVQEMDENRSGQAVGEHEVKQEHAREPGIGPSEHALVRVAVSELSVAAYYGGPHHPPETTVEDGFQYAEREKVRGRYKNSGVKYLRNSEPSPPKEEPIHNLERYDCAIEENPPKADFFHDARPKAGYCSAPELELGISVVFRFVTRKDRVEEGDASSPN